MTVKELIKALQGLGPDLEVMFYTDDSPSGHESKVLVPLEIHSIDVAHAERMRIDEVTPALRLGKSRYSTELVMVKVTSDI